MFPRGFRCALGGGGRGGATPVVGDEGMRKVAAQKRPKQLMALSKELLSVAAAPAATGGSNKQLTAATAADTKTKEGGLLELCLNAEILQSLLGMEGPQGGGPSRDGLDSSLEGAAKGARRCGAPWALLAPAAPVTPTTSTARGAPQAETEGSLVVSKQQKLQAAALLPLDMLQQLAAGLPELGESQQQQQQQQQDTEKLLDAAAVSKLQRDCSTEELSRMLEGTPLKQEAAGNAKGGGPLQAKGPSGSDDVEEGRLFAIFFLLLLFVFAAVCTPAAGLHCMYCCGVCTGGGPTADLLGEFLFKAPNNEIQEGKTLTTKDAADFVRFGRL